MFYPLQEWNITRQGCIDLITAEGLPQPGKSACSFCPMMKLCEIKRLVPGQRGFSDALEIRAEEGGKLKKIRGLVKGRNITWSEEEGKEVEEMVGFRI